MAVKINVAYEPGFTNLRVYDSFVNRVLDKYEELKNALSYYLYGFAYYDVNALANDIANILGMNYLGRYETYEGGKRIDIEAEYEGVKVDVIIVFHLDLVEVMFMLKR